MKFQSFFNRFSVVGQRMKAVIKEYIGPALFGIVLGLIIGLGV